MRPDSLGLYHLDAAHLHLLPSFVAQGWHAPRLSLRISELEVDPHVRLLNSIAILDLAHNEHVALKIEDGQLQARGMPSPRLCVGSFAERRSCTVRGIGAPKWQRRD